MLTAKRYQSCKGMTLIELGLAILASSFVLTVSIKLGGVTYTTIGVNQAYRDVWFIKSKLTEVYGGSSTSDFSDLDTTKLKLILGTQFFKDSVFTDIAVSHWGGIAGQISADFVGISVVGLNPLMCRPFLNRIIPLFPPTRHWGSTAAQIRVPEHSAGVLLDRSNISALCDVYASATGYASAQSIQIYFTRSAL